jgi:hypothetical protein
MVLANDSKRELCEAIEDERKNLGLFRYNLTMIWSEVYVPRLTFFNNSEQRKYLLATDKKGKFYLLYLH